MGYFSKTCAKTNLPVVANSVPYDELNLVIALLPNGDKLEGSYDGYGRINDIELPMDDWEEIKFVLKKHYNGEQYHELGESHREMGQGFFLSPAFLKLCIKKGGFKDYPAYERAFNKHCY